MKSMKVFSREIDKEFMILANDFIDVIMPLCSPNAFKVLMLIYRKTRGWNKDMDQLSFSQIMAGTGIRSKHTVIKALEELYEAMLILRASSESQWDADSYGLNPNYDTGLLSGAENAPAPGAENAPAPGAENAPTKDIEKQETHEGAENQNLTAEEVLDNVFGANPRKNGKRAEPLKRQTPDELLLSMLAQEDVPQHLKRKLSEIRNSGWQIRETQVELMVAEFLSVTGFPVPGGKSQRSLFISKVREHLDEPLFEGQLADLYKTVWSDIEGSVREGTLTITHPGALNQWMYAIVNAQVERRVRVDRPVLLQRLKNAGLVVVKLVDDGARYVWAKDETLVGQVPRELVDEYGYQ